MNYIITKPTQRMPHHTTLGPLVESFGGRHEKYNWLFTDYEAYFGPFWDGSESISSPKVLSGKELTQLASEFPDGQIIWGVLTGIPLNIKIDPLRLTLEPVAESGTTFWENMPKLQYPGAVVEIVAWDSSQTLLLSTDIELSSAFKAYFPEAENLDEFNRVYSSTKEHS